MNVVCGQFQACWANLAIFWNIFFHMDLFWPLSAIFNHFGPFPAFLGHFRSLLHLLLFLAIVRHFQPFFSPSHFGPFSLILDPFLALLARPFAAIITIFSHFFCLLLFQLFWAICGSIPQMSVVGCVCLCLSVCHQLTKSQPISF